MQDAAAVCDVLGRAADAMLNHDHRTGSTVDLPDKGRLLVTGDVHDHRENMRRILKLARLEKGEDHHLVVQEMIHGERLVNGMDFSYRGLVRIASLMLEYPGRVHMLLANHELAQANGEGISKDAVNVVEVFDAGIDYVFGEDAEKVHAAIERFVHALPLALRCANGLMCLHSLPAASRRATFDPGLIERDLTDADRHAPTGGAYLLVWGRNFEPDWTGELAARWGCTTFVIGHQPAEFGYELEGDRVLIINSDHEHGVVLPVDLAKPADRDELVDQLVPLGG